MEKKIEENNNEAGATKESSSSVELKRTTRGVNITTKIYTSDTDADIDRITHKAQSVFDKLQGKYKEE